MTSVKRRLLANFGANTLGRILGVVVQLVSVPVMLSHWGARIYGEWILLSTIPSYFAMSDIGFGNVAANEMTILVAGGKQDEALDVFQSVNLLILAVSVVFGAVFLVGVWTLPFDRWLRANNLIDPRQLRLILAILGITTLITLQENLFHASFQCVGKKALGTTAKSVVSFAVFIGQVVAVMLGADLLKTAIVTSVITIAGTVGLWKVLFLNVKWIRFGIQHARLGTIRRLLWPAVHFMSFPISNLLNLQGILMLIGHVLGPVSVVMFSTARTISRSVLQALQLINSSVWPEVSAAFGSGSIAMLRKLHRTSCQLSIILCVITTGLIAVFGNGIWKVWTLGKFQTDPVLLNIFLLQMFLGAFWYTSSVVPAATNNHSGISKVILGVSCVSFALSYPIMRIGSLGLRGVAVVLVLGDLIIALSVLRTSLRLAEDTVPHFCRSLLTVPAVLPRGKVSARQ
jgi:O-antigen/teichoic acid export membrane protein